MKKQNWRLFIKIGLICLFVTSLLNCGYSFAPRGEYIDKRIQKVYIESFRNKTAQAYLENYVSRLKVVESVESADATIKGTILNISTTPLAYGANTLVTQERATMALELTFQEKESGKTIWSSKSITGTVDYTLEDDINLLPVDRKYAFIKLSDDLAEKAFNLMMAGF